ncbi:hypothetical protein JX266_011517, partial [Neoarthrinium moseri]
MLDLDAEAALEQKLAAHRSAERAVLGVAHAEQDQSKMNESTQSHSSTVGSSGLPSMHETAPGNIEVNHDSIVDGLVLNTNMELDSIAWLASLNTETEGHVSSDSMEGALSPGFISASPYQRSTVSSEVDGAEITLPEMTRADLDAVFFERVHPFAPMIHKRSFFSWADQQEPSQARICLRFAMWTLAATLSVHFQDISHKLYIYTRKLLHRMDGNDQDLLWTTGEVHLEQIQAWLLIGHYELIRMEHNYALLTATRTSRLVQLANLHVIDAFSDLDAFRFPTDTDTTPFATSYIIPDNVWAIKEEKRRTFWVAFCFDRLINANDSLFFALHEES